MRRTPVFAVLSLAMPLLTALGVFIALRIPFADVYQVIPLFLAGPIMGVTFSIIAMVRKERCIFLGFAGDALSLIEFWWGVVAILSRW